MQLGDGDLCVGERGFEVADVAFLVDERFAKFFVGESVVGAGGEGIGEAFGGAEVVGGWDEGCGGDGGRGTGGGRAGRVGEVGSGSFGVIGGGDGGVDVLDDDAL